jgi:hypothetical protein
MTANFYWADQETHPATLPMVAREAWHRDAWDREQDELGLLVGGDVTEYPETSSVTAAILSEKVA